MGIDVETYNETLGGTLRILWKREKKGCRARRVKDSTINPINSTNQNSWGLTDTEPIIREAAFVSPRSFSYML